MGLALVAAYAVYEALLFAATWLLASGSGAFAVAVICRIFMINAVALGLLVAVRLVVHRLIGAPDRVPGSGGFAIPARANFET